MVRSRAVVHRRRARTRHTRGRLEGCDAAYYLVHSIGTGGDFAATEATAARNVRDAADAAGLRRIVYLGGMGSGDALSKHLASRHHVGEILASGRTATTELRAAVIIGSGSISFEMLRYLTEVLPAMITPRWVRTKCQPIAISDVLHYLTAVLDDPETIDRVLEIGGTDVVSYAEMMQTYAEVAGLPRRVIVPVPLLSPRLSSRWVGLVTPLPARIAVPLIDSLRHEVVMTNHDIDTLVPHQPLGFRESLELALRHTRAEAIDTRWTDAGFASADAIPGDPDWAGGSIFEDHQTVESDATADALYRASPASAGSTATTSSTGRGRCGGWPTRSSADPGYDVAGAIRSTCDRARRSTSGVWSRWSPATSWCSKPR